MSAAELCNLADCRIIDFMVHDRVAWGGTLFAIAVMYVWLVLFPLTAGRAWAWWLAVTASVIGLGGFFAYLSYGYLDTWHGLGTLLLIPVTVEGLRRTRRLVEPESLRTVVTTRPAWRSDSGPRLARELALLVAFGLTVAGAVIVTIGGSIIFVPSDLAFLGFDSAELTAVNRRLVQLIAHDRAGFGAGVLVGGVLIGGGAWFAERQRALWQAIGLGGGVAFGAALLVHVVVGYTDPLHLAPAVAAAGLLIVIVCQGRGEAPLRPPHH